MVTSNFISSLSPNFLFNLIHCSPDLSSTEKDLNFETSCKREIDRVRIECRFG
ncbi:hypothetical protein HanXRQr2_Chr02g0062161 [Helianthus annuus]|uniref:Uncharacterized protein n=1 Tax=Helianthus annuus TaxID=4232 RepID=A0A9K3JNA0_HELAN|nr:hypothetical protein HanXRQr2_Chr02g0062161 [Helianthus annuus]KAJ0951532.1 hypothetical protein HanPSC8_Chr02g0061181 [Helianthus annuus]